MSNQEVRLSGGPADGRTVSVTVGCKTVEIPYFTGSARYFAPDEPIPMEEVRIGDFSYLRSVRPAIPRAVYRDSGNGVFVYEDTE